MPRKLKGAAEEGMLWTWNVNARISSHCRCQVAVLDAAGRREPQIRWFWSWYHSVSFGAMHTMYALPQIEYPNGML